MTAPLDDLTVIDLTVARAGPTAVRQLADWGARVIRVESTDPGQALMGDHASADYINLHRSKTLVQLDLRRAEDRARFYDLTDVADVVVENFRAPVKFKLGVDHETLAARNPRLIYASISGYGQDGPYRERGAVDQIVQGMGGLMGVTGEVDGPPMRSGIAVSDMAAGNQLAIGILIALHERARSGRGQWVQVSLLEAMISFLDFQAVRWTIDGHVPASEGNHHPTAAPMGAYTAADGHLNVAAPSDRLWHQLCAALDDPALANDERFGGPGRRYRNRGELNALLDERFSHRTRSAWIERLDAVGVPCGAVLAMDEVFADPQVRHLRMTASIDHPTRGPVEVIRNSITMSQSRPVTPTTSPVPPTR
ncbi:MAG: CaiB/BaiF CoA transferase family protein [Desertimonas sp.]